MAWYVASNPSGADDYHLFICIDFSIKMSYKLLLAAIVVIVCLGKLSTIGRRPKGYPPGPPTIPLLGNIHLVLVYFFTSPDLY